MIMDTYTPMRAMIVCVNNTGDYIKKEDAVKAMEIYGFPAQAAMVVEECSELTNAICKFRRGRVGNDDIITEIADVIIMCEQLSYYFGKEKVELEKERKKARKIKRTFIKIY